MGMVWNERCRSRICEKGNTYIFLCCINPNQIIRVRECRRSADDVGYGVKITVVYYVCVYIRIYIYMLQSACNCGTHKCVLVRMYSDVIQRQESMYESKNAHS